MERGTNLLSFSSRDHELVPGTEPRSSSEPRIAARFAVGAFRTFSVLSRQTFPTRALIGRETMKSLGMRPIRKPGTS